MKAKMINATRIEGYIYESKLEEKTAGATSAHPGVKYIAGDLNIATDNAGTNIVTVHYTYVVPTTSTGKNNPNYTVLSDIISGKYKTAMRDGINNATYVRIDSAIGLNEFYTESRSNPGTEELVSAKRNEGGFIRIVNPSDIATDEHARATFDVDMIITGSTYKEADPEKDLPAKLTIKGAIFDFRKALLPIEFAVTNPSAINYFESLEASNTNPVFTRIRGQQISTTIKRTYTEESAFGEASVREVTSSKKEYVVTWAAKDPYVWDDEDTITIAELKDAMANREMTVATLKQRREEYKASQGQKPISTTTSGFNF